MLRARHSDGMDRASARVGGTVSVPNRSAHTMVSSAERSVNGDAISGRGPFPDGSSTSRRLRNSPIGLNLA